MDPGVDTMAAANLENAELRAEVERLEALVENLQSHLGIQDDALDHSLDVGDSSLPEGQGSPLDELKVVQPLMMDDILRHLFGYLDCESLKSARRVCSKWAESSISSFRERAGMAVCNLNVIDRCAQQFENVFLASTPESKRLTSLFIEKPTVFHEMLKRPWFGSYSSGLKRLELGTWIYRLEGIEEYIESKEIIHLTDVENLLLETCPNLKQLMVILPFPKSIARDADFVPRDAKVSRVTRLDILQLGPDPEKLSDDDYDSWQVDGGIGVSLLLLVVLGSIEKLKTLQVTSSIVVGVLHSVWDRIDTRPLEKSVLEGIEELILGDLWASGTLFRKLCELNFRNLKALKVGGSWDFDPRVKPTLVRLLSQVSTTLESLEIKDFLGGSEDSETVINLPELPNLKLYGNVNVAGWRHESMDFVLKMPLLEKLNLEGISEAGTRFRYLFHPGNQLLKSPHLLLKKLEICCLEEDLVAEDFGMIRKSFPNLEFVDLVVFGKGLNLKGCFEELASLLKLKTLTLNLHFLIQADELMSICTALQNFPALRTLSLGACCTENFPSLTPEIFTRGLQKCPILNQINLWGIELQSDRDWAFTLGDGPESRFNICTV